MIWDFSPNDFGPEAYYESEHEGMWAGEINMVCASDDILYRYHSGPVQVIGFDGRNLTNDRQQTSCHRLLQLLREHDSAVLAVDLAGVPVVNSWVLGILAALRGRGMQVELYHPTPEMRELLSTTHLTDLLHVR